MIFEAGNAHENASLFNLKEKKINLKDGKIWTQDPDGLIYYAND